MYECLQQAKHFVWNGWSQTRVHLIFDYMDPQQQQLVQPLPQLVQLQVGQKLLQTRRTIDVAHNDSNNNSNNSNNMIHPCPAFIILGGQKVLLLLLLLLLCD